MDDNQKVRKNRKIKLLSGAERNEAENHVTKEIFCLLLRQNQKRDKKTRSSGLFNALVSATIFCRPALLLFGA